MANHKWSTLHPAHNQEKLLIKCLDISRLKDLEEEWM